MSSKGRVRHFEGYQGLKITADEHGEPGAPPVIFLHGGGQTRHAWGDAARRFADEGFYTLTLDLRGHGDSGWAPGGEYDSDHFVGDLRAVLEQMPASEQRPALVGASLGGIVALMAVGTAEAAIARALVLVDIVPRINPEGARRIGDFMTANPEGFASVEEAADAVSAYIPHRPRPKDVSGLRKNLRLGDDDRLYWHWDPAFLAGPEDVDPNSKKEQLDAAAGNVDIPTLLVKGGISDIVDAEGVEEFRRVFPRGKIVDVQGAGHMVAGDKKNAFDEAVLTFLQRL